MQFSKIRVAGFKSFAESVELSLSAGVTAVVGPNGCGKSNIVEAFRWAMGESSARRLRSDEMDHVIFSGSEKRPSRNLAEVALTIDNSQRLAPERYNAFDEITVTRRIERGAGSSYRLNDRDILAREINTFFADLSSGAETLSIAGQGQIALLIQAKPQERRALLEEAAGTRGLHVRRREAEAKLKAAETNLLRVDDIIRFFDEQHQKLRREAVRAKRYRTVEQSLRKLETLAILSEWKKLSSLCLEAEKEKITLLGQQGHVEARRAKKQILLDEATQTVEKTRQEDIEAAARLQRAVIERENARANEARAQENLEGIKTRRAETQRDIVYNRQSHEEISEKLAVLSVEMAKKPEKTSEQNQCREKIKILAGQIEKIKQERDMALRQESEIKGRTAEYDRRQKELNGQREKITRQIATITARLSEMQEYDNPGLEAEMQKHNEERQKLQAECTEIEEKTLPNLRQAEDKARQLLDDIAKEREKAIGELRRKEYRITAEIETLEAAMAEGNEKSDYPSLVEQVKLEAGIERALSAALDDDLNASTDGKAAIAWLETTHSELPPLPEGAVSIQKWMQAPELLSPRLSQTGLVDSKIRGEALQPLLKPGQRLVSREGYLWRWDGYRCYLYKPREESKLLQKGRRAELEKNRLDIAKEVEELLREHDARLLRAESTVEKTHLTLVDMLAREREGRQKIENSRAKTELVQEQITLAERKSRMQEQLEAFEIQLVESQKALEQLEMARGEINQTPPADQEKISEKLTGFEREYEEIQKTLADFDAQEKIKEERLQQYQADHREGQKKSSEYEQRILELEEREKALADEYEKTETRLRELKANPDNNSDDVLRALEQKRDESGEILATREKELRVLKENQAELENEHRQQRESLIRLETLHEQRQAQKNELEEKITRDFEETPEQLMTSFDEPLSEDSVEMLHEKIIRARHKRDSFGGVNLCAEEEAEEAHKKLDSLSHERRDLDEAIGRLKKSADILDRQAQEKIKKAFEELAVCFSETFKRLFGGGRASLVLTDEDNLLTTGLDIVASPPGKKLQSLKLLSGGEQTLAALALIFSVFSIKPAPLFILDEVDAALDDPNVGRFCDLLDRMAGIFPETRFLVITHHRMTMSRAERLLGVTMAEKGVSQIVTVDLQTAIGMADQEVEQKKRAS